MKCSCAVLLAGGLLGNAALAASQQGYPSRPIRIISPYAPGGGNTIMARLVGDKLTERLGQQVIVDNRPGGNTIIGTEQAARATPDGYTFLLAGAAHVVVPLVFKTPFDPIKDFAEGGVPGFEARGWYGVLAPAATPKSILDKVSAVISAALASAEIKTRLNSLGVDPFISTPEQFEALMKADTAKWLKVLESGNIKLEH